MMLSISESFIFFSVLCDYVTYVMHDITPHLLLISKRKEKKTQK